jgi:hypothetical protein
VHPPATGPRPGRISAGSRLGLRCRARPWLRSGSDWRTTDPRCAAAPSGHAIAEQHVQASVNADHHRDPQELALRQGPVPVASPDAVPCRRGDADRSRDFRPGEAPGACQVAERVAGVRRTRSAREAKASSSAGRAGDDWSFKRASCGRRSARWVRERGPPDSSARSASSSAMTTAWLALSRSAMAARVAHPDRQPLLVREQSFLAGGTHETGGEGENTVIFAWSQDLVQRRSPVAADPQRGGAVAAARCGLERCGLAATPWRGSRPRSTPHRRPRQDRGTRSNTAPPHRRRCCRGRSYAAGAP